MKITFIGGGNMAAALIGGLVKGAVSGQDIRVVEPDEHKLAALAQQFGITGEAALAQASGADVVVLAVKPQQLRNVAQALAEVVQPAQLVISIAAGIRLADLQRWLGGHDRLVRVMPNTPALIGSGVSGAFAAPAVDAIGRAAAQTILEAVGSVVWLTTEAQIDAVTAVSGSGPAYVFYFLEALQAAAKAQGFASDVARQLALETFAGAVKLAQSTDEPLSSLRAKVTSKGGTTERAIGIMEVAGIKDGIVAAVAGAAQRSQELAEELGRD